MGLIRKRFLNGDHIYGCSQCATHLAPKDGIMSTAFQGQNGRAYLFRAVVNIIEGPAQERPMTTGKHVVCDIECMECHQVVGWRYIKAYEESQRYKEGRFILEKKLLTLLS
ncbi:Yippee/Mis18 [Syncephalis pseudoplumigaleata]|uniref:Protein yippee-like n=1 Tax=Syncephalis pseudoplumigaleata TaxID=1712513 RepID=A0A4P9Z4C8_9FUNG|nr:Yippee/Mis18 [Syncephalis pseudoplumigaleata]|eukprot:RKP27427.1 Yippee/Mis18 [Syncephalis pseudoplumigaleata]